MRHRVAASQPCLRNAFTAGGSRVNFCIFCIFLAGRPSTAKLLNLRRFLIFCIYCIYCWAVPFRGLRRCQIFSTALVRSPIPFDETQAGGMTGSGRERFSACSKNNA